MVVTKPRSARRAAPPWPRIAATSRRGEVSMTPEQEQFLRDHRLAVLATGRRDGSPQISTMGYWYDGTHIFMSLTTDRAKWHNVGRQPRVAMTVNEGPRQLVLYGTAERISEDPLRTHTTRAIRAAFYGKPADDGGDEKLAAELDRDRR